MQKFPENKNCFLSFYREKLKKRFAWNSEMVWENKRLVALAGKIFLCLPCFIIFLVSCLLLYYSSRFRFLFVVGSNKWNVLSYVCCMHLYGNSFLFLLGHKYRLNGQRNLAVFFQELKRKIRLLIYSILNNTKCFWIELNLNNQWNRNFFFCQSMFISEHIYFI
jgi:hypothetical protein